MPLKRLLGHARAAWEVPRDLLLRRYPPFVTGGALPRGDVPVFVFHSLEPVSFERKLRHIADNGYVTLSAEEYFRILVGVGQVPDKAVVLTFDDGRGSVHGVGGPLLRRYGMKGIVFLVPERVAEGGERGPTWDDVQAGRVRPEAVLGREANGGAFLNWAEVAALANSGVFEFESHSLTHARVHIAPHLAGFVTPDLRRGYAALDLPLVRDGNADLMGEEVPLGTPILRSESRLSESARFFEDPAIRADCIALVRDLGEEGFFLRPDWAARLRQLVARRRIVGALEERSDREAAQARELRESKRRIEERTGRPVIHLCYPWHVSGPTARRLAREAGYRTAFAGKVPGTPITRVGGDPLQIARIGEDYVELLPGRGREELGTVLQRKWSRRLHGRP